MIAVISVNPSVFAEDPPKSAAANSENMVKVQVTVTSGVPDHELKSMSPILEIYLKLRRELKYDEEAGERLRKETEGMSLKGRFMRDVRETQISGKGNCRTISHRVLYELYQAGIECYSVIICLGKESSHAAVMCVWNGKRYIIDLANDCGDGSVKIFTVEVYLKFLKINYKKVTRWFIIYEKLDKFDKDFDFAWLRYLSLIDGTEMFSNFPGIPVCGEPEKKPKAEPCKRNKETSESSLPKKQSRVCQT